MGYSRGVNDVTDNDTLALVTWRSRPRSFVALMSLYESNFVRLVRLAGRLSELHGEYRSCVTGDCDLRLTVTDRAAYTITCEFTYLLAEAPRVTYPDLTLRIYLDANLAEAQGWAAQHDHPALRELRAAAERELDQRWARNMMLNKWLEYCMDRGHSFRLR